MNATLSDPVGQTTKRYVIRFQRAARAAGTLASCFDSDNLGDATRQLKAAYRQSTRNCRYWIEIAQHIPECESADIHIAERLP
jgi:hypothetical protein